MLKFGKKQQQKFGPGHEAVLKLKAFTEVTTTTAFHDW